MKSQHIDPNEAVQIHQDLKARRSVGIHWGTFILTSEVSFINFYWFLKYSQFEKYQEKTLL